MILYVCICIGIYDKQGPVHQPLVRRGAPRPGPADHARHELQGRELRYTILHCTVLHSTLLYYTTPHYTTR